MTVWAAPSGVLNDSEASIDTRVLGASTTDIASNTAEPSLNCRTTVPLIDAETVARRRRSLLSVVLLQLSDTVAVDWVRS